MNKVIGPFIPPCAPAANGSTCITMCGDCETCNSRVSPLGRLEREAAELAAEEAPRRFALCWIDAEEDDGGVLYWGLEFRGGGAVVYGEGGRSFGIFQGAEAAWRRFSRVRTVTLVWLDAPRGPDSARE